MNWKALPMADTDEEAEGATAGKAVPPPPILHLSRITWKKDQLIHRIHADKYAGNAFNPGLQGNARFSPIKDSRAIAIPTLYGGDTFECAAMETVFHDVPYAPGPKTYDKGKLAGQTYTQLSPAEDLVLADLGSKALRKLGVQRKQLIDTEKDQYPITRLWAEAIHAHHPEVQGLCWTSRQDDGAKALVLFGDRVQDGSLRQVSVPASLTGHADCYGNVLALAEHIGVNIVPGKG
jgi:hypothetical protein